MARLLAPMTASKFPALGVIRGLVERPLAAPLCPMGPAAAERHGSRGEFGEMRIEGQDWASDAAGWPALSALREELAGQLCHAVVTAINGLGAL